jgi:hypothetical protein
MNSSPTHLSNELKIDIQTNTGTHRLKTALFIMAKRFKYPSIDK